jgi:hypothetical protein
MFLPNTRIPQSATAPKAGGRPSEMGFQEAWLSSEGNAGKKDDRIDPGTWAAEKR